MLRDFAAVVRAARLARIAVALAVAVMVAACGIKGPLRPPPPVATTPTTPPSATDAAPPATDPDPSAPRKP